MKLRARIAATLLLAFACLQSLAQSITPESLAIEIRASGARAVLLKYFDTPEWEQQIIPGVKAGSSTWLAVARDLSAVADAAPSEELSQALYAALPVRPFAVLSALGSKHGFEAESLCNVSFEAEVPEEGALPYITRVRNSLRSASTPEERRVAAACRRGLARAEASVKRARLK